MREACGQPVVGGRAAGLSTGHPGRPLEHQPAPVLLPAPHPPNSLRGHLSFAQRGHFSFGLTQSIIRRVESLHHTGSISTSVMFPRGPQRIVACIKMPSLGWRAGRRPGQRRGIPIASRPGVATTRVEAAPGRRFSQIEDGTGDALQRLTPLGDGVDEPGRVRVFGGGEYRIRTTHFHQLGSVLLACKAPTPRPDHGR